MHVLAGFKVVETTRGSKCDALVRTVSLLQTSRDLPLHIVAHAFVAVLHRTRQQRKARKQYSPTHQRNLRHGAVALQTLRNQTTPRISQLVVTLHHTPSHVPLTYLIRNTTSRTSAKA